MNNIYLILCCLALGLVLKRIRAFPDNASITLNQYVIYVSLPALILWQIPTLNFSIEAFIPALISWLLLAMTALLTLVASRFFHWSKQVTACLMLLIPLGNTSFLGLPLLQAMLGEEAVIYGLLYDQFGSFLALSTYGLWIVAFYSGDSSDMRVSIKRIITFPPFVAMILAILLTPWEYPNWLTPILMRLGETLVPVVMIAVGLQWQLKLDKQYAVPMSFALSVKLGLMPLIAYLILRTSGEIGLVEKVTILEAGMAPMISAGALAISHGFVPRLAASIVGYGLLICLFTIPVLSQILHQYH